MNNIIVVRTAEDMDKIVKWYSEFIRISAPLDSDGYVEFQVPFQNGKIQCLFQGLVLEFENDEKNDRILFKLYFDPEHFKVDWAKNNDALLGGFSVTFKPFTISNKWFNMKSSFAEAARKMDEEHSLFTVQAYQWFVLMMLAVYYRPEFESQLRTVEATRKSGKGGKKAKSKRVKTLYTRTYIMSDITDKLPKPVKRHTKPDHEYGVRGHYRRYKSSGKVVWVHPHTRCKGRGAVETSVYIAKIEEARKQ